MASAKNKKGAKKKSTKVPPAAAKVSRKATPQAKGKGKASTTVAGKAAVNTQAFSGREKPDSNVGDNNSNKSRPPRRVVGGRLSGNTEDVHDNNNNAHSSNISFLSSFLSMAKRRFVGVCSYITTPTTVQPDSPTPTTVQPDSTIHTPTTTTVQPDSTIHTPTTTTTVQPHSPTPTTVQPHSPTTTVQPHSTTPVYNAADAGFKDTQRLVISDVLNFLINNEY